jgi:hypothetical protein
MNKNTPNILQKIAIRFDGSNLSSFGSDFAGLSAAIAEEIRADVIRIRQAAALAAGEDASPLSDISSRLSNKVRRQINFGSTGRCRIHFPTGAAWIRSVVKSPEPVAVAHPPAASQPSKATQISATYPQAPASVSKPPVTQPQPEASPAPALFGRERAAVAFSAQMKKAQPQVLALPSPPPAKREALPAPAMSGRERAAASFNAQMRKKSSP